MGSGEGDAPRAIWQCLCCDAEYPVTRDAKSLDAPLAHVETCAWCDDWADGLDPEPCEKHHKEDDPTTAPVDPQ